MSAPFDLEHVILLWKQKYGTIKKSKKWGAEYYQIPVSERFECLKRLVEEVKDAGKEEEYFASTTRQDQIISHCVPHESSVTPKSLKSFIDGTRRHLKMAVLEVYKEKEEPMASAEAVSPRQFKEFDPGSVANTDEPKIDEELDPQLSELLRYQDE